MEMDGLDCCNICMNIYDDNVRPRVLTCGHSFCTSCLDKFIKLGTLVCPQCQQPHPVSSAHDLPINYGMEQMISNLRKAQLIVASSYESGATNKESQSNVHQQEPANQNFLHHLGTMSSKMQSLIHEHKESTQNFLLQNKEMQSQLHQYKHFLLERKVKHEDHYHQIMALASRCQEISKQINTEYENVADIQKKGESLENILKVDLERLNAVTSAKSALTAIDDLDKSYATLEIWNKSCQDQLPHAMTLSCSEKVMRETTAALSMVIREEIDEAASEFLDLSQSSLPIMDKVDRIRGTPLTLTCLQNKSNYVKNIVEKGLLYAVQEKDGHIRSGKVTVRNNRTYLHYLQDGKPPAHAQTIKQSDLIGTLDSDSVMAFMDLAWEGSIRGRIHILLSPGTPLALHFRILCSGILGPSYAHSRFLEVRNKGDAINEMVKCGDYEHNNGSGGAPVIRGINVDEAIYRRKCEPGIMWAAVQCNDGPKMAQFVINTGKKTDCMYAKVFGKVQEGLDVVKAAAKQDDICGVSIADCGVVLPL